MAPPRRRRAGYRESKVAAARSGVFHPSRPERYRGRTPPVWKSTWELRVMRELDSNPGVIEWAYEPFVIPYRDPLTGRVRRYVPDFWFRARTRKGHIENWVVEVKPVAETGLVETADPEIRAEIARNHAKWRAVALWCRRRGMKFRVLTERELFGALTSSRTSARSSPSRSPARRKRRKRSS